jgi:phage gp36-like protein
MQALWGAREVQVCSDWDNAGSLNTANVTNCLAAASDEMDRYIAVRYVLPLATPPDDLVRVCCDIGMYRLCPFAGTLTDQKAQRYKEAVAWLRDLSSGKLTLGIGRDGEQPAAAVQVQVTGQERTLTRDSMRRLF